MKGISDDNFTWLCLCLHLCTLFVDDSHVVPVVHKAIIEKVVVDVLLATGL